MTPPSVLAVLFLFLLVLLAAAAAIPTLLVYRRVYPRGLLHVSRAMGWLLVVVGLAFVPFIIDGWTGGEEDRFPWWFCLFILLFIAIGYALQRSMTRLLREGASGQR